jgi:predicted CXXCH cytochrome family protein
MLWSRAVVLLAVVSAHAATTASYVGAAACAKCHANIYLKWTHSRHSKMLQPATPQSVEGDFSRGGIKLRGFSYKLRESDGQYFISESELYGAPREHRVDYTLGSRRVQHYLTTLPSGRIVVLPPTWDALRKQWFHNYDIADPDESGDVTVQVWNKGCYSCHVSQEQKNYDAAKDEYKTSWMDFGTNCERCHGPGGEHVRNYSAASASTPARGARPSDIVVQTRLDPVRNTMVCAQCHSFRDIYAPGFSAGGDYYDYFVPILEYDQPVDKDPAYWPDGRTRRFSNDAYGLWQSECFLRGKATCLNCHSAPHEVDIDKNAQLRPDANALCAQCHAAIQNRLAAHTHHAPESAGSSCVECHMPRTVLSIKAEIRDHSMSIPVPENTTNHGIPNACNNCHKDRDPKWAVAAMDKWWGNGSRQNMIRRADAFTAARTGKVDAVPALMAILTDESEGPLVRTNAIGYLSRFGADARVTPVLLWALGDSQPPVRAAAAMGLGMSPENRQEAAPALARSLADTSAIVRLNAAVSLVSLGIRDLPAEDGARFERAKEAYRARAALNADDPEQQFAAGKFYFLTGDPAAAIDAWKAALKLDPESPAKLYLASAYARQGQLDDARRVLQDIPPTDARYQKAQALLKQLTR